MLLDLRIMLAASFAAVLLLLGGFGLIAALRTPGKPSVEISAGPAEITGSIGARDKKFQSLTDEDKAARPAEPAAETARPAPAPEPVRAVNVEKTEKARASKDAEEDKPAQKRAAAAKAKPKPKRAAARQNTGANFNANNPFSSPFFGAGAAPSQ